VTSEEISFSVVIRECAQRGNADGAAKWLRAMISSPQGPNVFAFNAVIAAFAKRGKAPEAAAWLRRMGEEVTPCRVCTGSDTDCSNCGGKGQQGLEQNVMSYTAVIDACALAGDAEGSVKWFDEMLSKGIMPNERSYNAVINAWARRGEAAEAVRWLERMREEGAFRDSHRFQPDEISYNTAIHGCAVASPPRASLAERLFREMVKMRGLKPTASTMTALDRAAGRGLREKLCKELGLTDRSEAWKHINDSGLPNWRHRPVSDHRRIQPLARPAPSEPATESSQSAGDAHR